VFYSCFGLTLSELFQEERATAAFVAVSRHRASLASAVCDSKLRCIVVGGFSGVIQLLTPFKACCSANHSRTEVCSRSLFFLLVDSEYSYCRMSKLFILPAALKTAKAQSPCGVFPPEAVRWNRKRLRSFS